MYLFFIANDFLLWFTANRFLKTKTRFYPNQILVSFEEISYC